MKRLVILLALCFLSLPSFSQNTVNHPWFGAKVAFIGDSITDPGKQQENHDWTGHKDTHYWGWLQDWLGVQPFVYGVSGKQWNDVPRQAEELKKEHGDDFDAITVFLGTNDFIGDVPLGEWYEFQLDSVVRALGYKATNEPMMSRRPVMDERTFKGRINIGISTLKRMYPTKQIVIFTPIHRAYSTFGDQNIQPDESFPNRIGVYFSEYAEVVKEAGNVWGVPVIDLNSLCGLNPMVEEQVMYFNNKDTDRLHPNGEGHKRIAKTLQYQLLSLPCKF